MRIPSSSSDFTPLANFSRVKIGLLALFVLGLAIVPNLSGFGEGLRYTAFFYTDVGAVIRIVACAFLGIIGLILAVVFFEATFISPMAVWVEGGELRWRSLGVKSMPLSAIQSVTLQPRHIKISRTDGSRSVEFSMLLLRSSDAPEPLMSRLQAAAVLQT